tara:strand:- start:1120 stop:2682 length:1563 start_codon:yes stop_codon:yes gene_type:complete
MPKQLPVPIQRSEYDRLLPVEKMHYDMLTNKEGYDFDQSKTTVRVSPQFFVTIPDPPRGYDPAQGRGGGKFYAPAEGKVVYVEKDAEGNVTYTEREHPARTVHFRNAAELQQELDRRRVQGEFSRGRDGLYGLVPFDIYQQKEATARVEAEIDKLGPGAARGLDDDVRNPELLKNSDPVGDALPEPEQVKTDPLRAREIEAILEGVSPLTEDAKASLKKELATLKLRKEVSDKPVKESKDAAKDVVKTDALRKEKAEREKTPPPSEPGTGLPPRSGKAEAETPPDAPREPITPRSVPASEVEPSDPTDPALPKRERKDPEKELESEVESAERREEIDDIVGAQDFLSPLEEALKVDEPEKITVGEDGDEITLDPLAPSPEIPESPDDPDLLGVKLEEPPEPPMEAGSEDPQPQPEVSPAELESEEPVDVDVELEQEDTPSAEEIESFAADTVGMEYLRGAFVEFARYAYNPASPLDRRRMDFLAKFLQDAQFPQGDERALVARKAFDRMKAQSVEQMKEG